ncbi:MAG: antitoxin family protein [Patescibacteria group bacterium]|nr:antitoxin family protein [Patescibacteria group bacterium]
MALHAIYENGVFRPSQPVDLPDRCEVEFEVRAVSTDPRSCIICHNAPTRGNEGIHQ